MGVCLLGSKMSWNNPACTILDCHYCILHWRKQQWYCTTTTRKSTSLPHNRFFSTAHTAAGCSSDTPRTDKCIQHLLTWPCRPQASPALGPAFASLLAEIWNFSGRKCACVNPTLQMTKTGGYMQQAVHTAAHLFLDVQPMFWSSEVYCLIFFIRKLFRNPIHNYFFY